MSDRATITALATAAADGDREALAPLYAALWPAALAFATRFVGDRALAEDCAQDALVQMFGQLERFERTRDALAWALAFVAWQCRTARRRTHRRAEVGDPDAALAARSTDDDARANLIERDLLRAALAEVAALPAHDVEVIAAALADDEIALRGRLAPATFRKRLERALARLRLSWRSRHDTT